MMNYDTMHESIKENVGLDVPFKKLKFIYENAEWRQVKPQYDLLNNFHEIDSVCSNGNFLQSADCVADYSIWTGMKQFKPTEDLYQFIHYHAATLKTQVDRDIIKPLNHVFSIMETHMTGPMSDFILNCIEFIGCILGLG
ncbi:hypothetical protein [Heyndrickxia camelliae]|uniref:Uncharacterized protein n=1 Tax=Heyndrickxia camelliae TaxID=1707093 RepID=A0A2N3LCZ9_9BACI|nr:hypothetical protein [Heyndrickxia camelliae]PKR82443.1 hypothetical protein CWO92_24375 [Heyndrickxia camelliae]